MNPRPMTLVTRRYTQINPPIVPSTCYDLRPLDKPRIYSPSDAPGGLSPLDKLKILNANRLVIVSPNRPLTCL
jgi:hypothetical protein